MSSAPPAKYMLKPLNLARSTTFGADEISPPPPTVAATSSSTVAADTEEHIPSTGTGNSVVVVPDVDSVAATDDDSNQVVELSMDNLELEPPSKAVSFAVPPEPPTEAPSGTPVHYHLKVSRADMAVAFQVMLTALDRFQKAGQFHFSESAEIWKAIQIMNSGLAQLPPTAIKP